MHIYQIRLYIKFVEDAYMCPMIHNLQYIWIYDFELEFFEEETFNLPDAELSSFFMSRSLTV